MYNKIYDFCRVRNFGNVYKNDPNEPTPRVKFLISLLESEGIEYVLDRFPISNHYEMPDFPLFRRRSNRKRGFFKPTPEPIRHPAPRAELLFGYNIILKGTSDRMVVAHHDVANHSIDNANDNSCSVINCIMIKKLMPNINVILLDGEEMGGLGSQRASDQINSGEFSNIDWVLNLELTGKGGKYFFIGEYPGRLTDHIKSLFDCPIVHTPFNDSVIFRRNGIDSCVINPIPPLPEGETSSVKWDEHDTDELGHNIYTYLDYSMLFNCHSSADSISSIDVNDMKEFVEDVILKILNN